MQTLPPLLKPVFRVSFHTVANHSCMVTDQTGGNPDKMMTFYVIYDLIATWLAKRSGSDKALYITPVH